MAGKDVEVRLRFTQSGVQNVDAAAKSLREFDAITKKAAEEGGGLKSMVKGATDAYYAWKLFSGSLQTSLSMVNDVNQLGTAAIRTAYAFKQFGGTEETLKKMADVTGGLISSFDMQKSAVLALSTNVVKTQADLIEFARIGSVLGIVLKNDAAGGMMALAKILDSPGYTRELRNLGVDATGVKKRFQELKEEFSDEDAWRMAVFEVAGKNADSMTQALTLTGSATERLQSKMENLASTLSQRVAVGLEATVGWWEKLFENPDLVLTVTLNTFQKDLTDGLNNAVRGPTVDGKTDYNLNGGSSKTLTSPMQQGDDPARMAWDAQRRNTTGQSFEPYYSRYIPGYSLKTSGETNNTTPQNNALDMLRKAGQQQKQDAYMEEILAASMPNSPINQRRKRAAAYDTGVAGNEALRKEYVAPIEAAQKQAAELKFVKGILGDINGIAGDYNSKLQAMLAPLKEQQRILEQRKSIQSVDDAFGTSQKDGLYGEIGGGMAGAIDSRKGDLEDKADAARKRYGANSKQYKAALAEVAQFEKEGKLAVDAYAIATGSATAESIRFKDQLDAIQANFEAGKISVSQYKNELLLMAEAAKSGATSMAALSAIQRRLNLDMRPGAKSATDKSVFDQYARGVKGTDSAKSAGEEETKPFDNVVTGAKAAANAAQDIGAKGAVALGILTVGSVLAASQMSNLASQAGNAASVVGELKATLNTLASLSININSTPRTGSDNTTRPARGPR